MTVVADHALGWFISSLLGLLASYFAGPNFWGALEPKKFVKRSEDYMRRRRRKEIGLEETDRQKFKDALMSLTNLLKITSRGREYSKLESEKLFESSLKRIRRKIGEDKLQNLQDSILTKDRYTNFVEALSNHVQLQKYGHKHLSTFEEVKIMWNLIICDLFEPLSGDEWRDASVELSISPTNNEPTGIYIAKGFECQRVPGYR
jgi:hypothetical protein